ncbi:hypothetical protein EXIGLDRAFT_760435 [Exidia glandulosa HHB12029]|uniref:Zn(2)-C6 fungal-type domain-containing protein n=1 Tax=Exidia glandulosa HHB12029 TaxID=1314781 RepID=A0A165P9B7_EXIGL|nr:hypothetical protein EXIGLDRAFT_760435 [Exidia glandulosa HHB12029]
MSHQFFYDGHHAHQPPFFAHQQFHAQPHELQFHPQLNVELNFDAGHFDNPGLDQQPPSALSSASPPTPHGSLNAYSEIGYGFAAHQALAGVAHDSVVVPPLYPPPPLGSSEHSYLYHPVDEPFYPPQHQQQQPFRAMSPSSSSLWRALEMPAAASNPESSAPGAVSTIPLAHPKSHLAPLRIATPRQQLPDLDSPLTPTSPPEPFFSASPNSERIQWQLPQAPGQSQSATPKQSRAGPARTPMKRASSGDRKPIMACLFCRGRKIACGGPLRPEAEDKTCNQCARRNLKCAYPVESHRGLRRTGKKSDAGSTSPHDVPSFQVAPMLTASTLPH